MIGQFVITLREGFEAILLVAIVVAYLKRTGRLDEVKYAYYGAFAALFSGAVIALAVLGIYGGLKGDQKGLFESMAAYIAVIVLTYMIIWMARKDVRKEVERKAEQKFAWGIAFVAFIFVVREVIETVLFLTPFAARDVAGTIAGVTAGIVVSIGLSLAILRFEYKLSLKKFFYVTSILLAFIASGLLGYGTHELIEVLEGNGHESWFFENAYSLGINESSFLHNKGVIGSIFAVLFGYSASMEYLRAFLQFGYLISALILIRWSYKAKSRNLSESRATPV